MALQDILAKFRAETDDCHRVFFSLPVNHRALRRLEAIIVGKRNGDSSALDSCGTHCAGLEGLTLGLGDDAPRAVHELCFCELISMRAKDAVRVKSGSGQALRRDDMVVALHRLIDIDTDARKATVSSSPLNAELNTCKDVVVAFSPSALTVEELRKLYSWAVADGVLKYSLLPVFGYSSGELALSRRMLQCLMSEPSG
eukprot:1370159-Alexandrium_andersonii.AAC.1